MDTALKVMKYMIAAPGREANEKSERRDRQTINELGYTLSKFVMQNANPVFLACKYGNNPMQSNCNLFRKLFTTKGIGYTFNNEAFYKMFINNTDNTAFFKEMHQLENDDTHGPKIITLNGKKRSFEFILNHIKTNAISSSNRLMIHSPYTIADARDEAIDLAPGMMYDIFLTPSVTVTDRKGLQLDYTQRKCFSARENSNLKIFRSYSQSACLFECQLTKAIEKCNCTAWNYPSVNNKVNLCWFEVANTCFEETMEELDPQSCDCPNDCDSIHYNIGISESFLNVEEICDVLSFLRPPDFSKM